VRFGIDLASLNIQRGRDHGLPNYNRVRAYYTGVSASSFASITSNTELANKLKSLYVTVNNVDLWVGILAEDRLPGKSVGKTMHAMLKAQFEKIRDGDYYFYRNDPYLPTATRNQVLITRLADVIKRNTTLTSLQANVFFISPCPGEDGEDRMIADNKAPDVVGNFETNEKNATEAKEIATIKEDAVFKIYPNPATNRLNVNLGNLGASSTIELRSSNGSLVKKFTAERQKTLQIDLTGLAKGIYMLNITSSKETRSFRFVKM
jgi:hypothetical protein